MLVTRDAPETTQNSTRICAYFPDTPGKFEKHELRYEKHEFRYEKHECRYVHGYQNVYSPDATGKNGGIQK